MLDLARAKNADLPADRFLHAASDTLPELAAFDVITAVQSHHYYPDIAGREGALRRCFSLLRPGGALVVFENVRAETDLGHALQRRRWAAFQHSQGRDEATVDLHLARENTKFFPIRVTEHLDLLKKIGFPTVEIVWRAHSQAGFLAIAPI
jgi:tRNA (cmo5U34)-methyltransferase